MIEIQFHYQFTQHFRMKLQIRKSLSCTFNFICADRLNEGGRYANSEAYSIDNVQTMSGNSDEEMELVIGSERASTKDGASTLKSVNKQLVTSSLSKSSPSPSGL